MGREKPHFRDMYAKNFDFLDDKFCGKFQVRISEVCDVLQMSRCAARARFSFDKNGWITLPTMARDMCE